VRRGVLRPGEALLDFVGTPDTTFAFVVTRAGTVARLLPGATRLDALYRDWQDVMLAARTRRRSNAASPGFRPELLTPVAGRWRGRSA
jgi:hypothetical protein